MALAGYHQEANRATRELLLENRIQQREIQETERTEVRLHFKLSSTLVISPLSQIFKIIHHDRTDTI
jgi:hypothetical protein